MEEVWKDINLPTSNHHAAVTKGYCGFILQDFLAKPFSSTQDTNTHTNVSSPPPPPPPQQRQPQMLLNLNSGPDQLSFLGHEDPTRNVCPLEGPFDQVLASSNSSGGLRMLPATDRTGGDRRHKRMIKNRESAARSRARKQVFSGGQYFESNCMFRFV
ncbi:bZIP transcription factor 27-like protein [Tanacetum coccineum]